jgi:hypothetical protein
MKSVDWFDRKVWLADLRLRDGEVLCVQGHTYRYVTERDKASGRLEHVLIPVDGTCK